MSKRIDYKALANRVLVVAKEGAIGDWACYIDAVAGNNHELEYKKVMNYGSKLPEKIANVLFPSFKRFNYRG